MHTLLFLILIFFNAMQSSAVLFLLWVLYFLQEITAAKIEKR